MMSNARRAGMMEYELEAWFDYTFKKNGIKETQPNSL